MTVIGLGAATGCLGKDDHGVASAQRRWAANAPAAYQFHSREVCFCPDELTREMIVDVRGGAVVAAIYADDGSPVGAATRGQILTVEGLFALLADAVDRGADQIDVTYDAALGYPRTIALDYHRSAADDERGFTLSGLVALP